MVKNENTIPAHTLNAVMETLKAGHVDGIDKERAEKLRYGLQETAKRSGGTANLGAALRMTMLTDAELMDEFTFNLESKAEMFPQYERAAKYMKNVFDRLNKSNSFKRAIDSDSGAGDNDFGGLFVEKMIKKRIEAETEILTVTDNKRLTQKQNKFPKSSNLAKAAFAAKSAALTDITTTVDNGFDNTTLEAQKFGATMFVEADAFVKLDAQTLNQIMDELVLAHSRGMRDQIYNGDGISPNATGMFTNATSIAFDGNVTNTLVKMIASIADVTRGGSKDIFILTNTAGRITLEGEKFIDKAYDDLIEIFGSANFLKRFNVIEDNVLVSSGASPDKTAPMLVGKRGDYIIGTQTDPQVEIDKYGDFSAGGETARIMNFWTGDTHYDDSFSKTTIPAIY